MLIDAKEDVSKKGSFYNRKDLPPNGHPDIEIADRRESRSREAGTYRSGGTPMTSGRTMGEGCIY